MVTRVVRIRGGYGKQQFSTRREALNKLGQGSLTSAEM